MKSDRPSLFRILVIDYIAFLAFLFPIVMWVIFFFKRSNPNSMFYINLAITAIAVPLLLWRIYFFIRMFDTGQETAAVIQGVSFYRDRGRVDYIYTYQGTRYASGNAIMKTKRTKQLAQGQQVTILVDPNRPKKAIIRQLYS